MKTLGWLIVSCLPVLAPLHVSAQAQFPSRSISMIVAAPPGGPADLAGRIVARALAESLGQPVTAENRPGSHAGAVALARAAPDGYTLGLIGSSPLTVTTGIGVDVPYKLDDFYPLGIVAFDITVVTARAEAPWKSINDVIANAKQHPNKLSYGASGIGSFGQMTMEVVKLQFGLDITFVPYGGAAPVNTAVLGGHVDLGSASLAATMPLIESGKLRPLAVSSAARLAALPNVPTLAELGRPDTPNLWLGVFVPAKTPAPIVQKLASTLGQVMKDPNTRTRLEQARLIVDYRDPEASRTLMATEVKVITELAKSVNLK
jgi:tripartite-type tricarboxylate transporter receptor subunit TctC